MHAPAADFYTPPVAAEALGAIGRLAGVGGLAFGGYAQAERCRILLGQEELVEGLRPDPEQVSCEAPTPSTCPVVGSPHAGRACHA